LYAVVIGGIGRGRGGLLAPFLGELHLLCNLTHLANLALVRLLALRAFCIFARLNLLDLSMRI